LSREHFIPLLSCCGPFEPGTVSLVGAGPGDPGLLTLKGAARLSQADAVLYDALVNERILSLARGGAELIAVGKRAGRKVTEQDQINQTMVALAKSGQRVVRLKGGDPYVFGRGGEEATILADAGVPFEVVCGVTAGVAAGAYAGVPLTHRSFASTAALVTGHEDPTKPESQIDYSALARMGTVVMYMGVQTLADHCRKLIEAGMDRQSPAIVVRWGTRADQHTVAGTLGNIAPQAKAEGIGPPAVAIIGRVAGLRDKLNWFERLPLFGQRVVITRPVAQAGELADRLTAMGAQVLAAPAIHIEPLHDYSAVDEALGKGDRYAWLVLTSVNGVNGLMARMEALGMDGRALAGVRLAAIGEGTARTIRARFLNVDCLPKTFTSRALAEAIVRCDSLAGKRVLLLRADIAGGELPQVLTEAGAVCDDLAIYRTVKPASLPEDVLNELGAGRADWITFTSSSTVVNFCDLAGAENLELVRSRVRIASIGPVTTGTLGEVGLTPTVEASPHTVAGLVEAIAAAAGRRDSSRA